jgi:glutamate/tyrosine decarboxylase-like PLP-dependent enzyme
MTIDLTPDEFRRLGYAAIDLLAAQLAHVRVTPTRQPMPDAARARLLHEPAPETPTQPDALLQRFADEILPYPMGNSSPRFSAWVNSPPAPLAVIGELLAAGLDSSVAGGDHAATYVEHAVLNWMKTIMRFPADAGALLVSGGSMANLVCLGAMRHAHTARADREGGMAGRAPLVVYMSEQGHSCLQKAVEVLGIGNQYLRRIPVDAAYRIDLDALCAQITADRAAGLQPACIAANAGTVNTGAIDPLDALADVCAAEGLWLHIDGAYGGVAILAQPDLYAGIERADSIAIDQHKWMYIPIECGCALVRDSALMRSTYSVIPPYLRDDRALPWFSEFGIQQTRSFRALKLWMVMQQIGLDGYRTLIRRDIDMARTLADKIRARADFDVAATGALSIVCYRYVPADMTDDQIDALNRALVKVVNDSGRAFLNATELNGRAVLRSCIVNFRTTDADLDALLDAVADAGRAVCAAQQPDGAQ